MFEVKLILGKISTLQWPGGAGDRCLPRQGGALAPPSAEDCRCVFHTKPAC